MRKIAALALLFLSGCATEHTVNGVPDSVYFAGEVDRVLEREAELSMRVNRIEQVSCVRRELACDECRRRCQAVLISDFRAACECAICDE